MGEHSRKYRFLGIAIIAAVILAGATAYGFHATSTTEFCTSCHEMQFGEQELKYSSHAKDKDGKAIGCSQCHLPQGIGPKYLSMKTYLGVKDLIVHLWKNPTRLNRVELQPTARRFMDDASCLACHEDLYKDGKGEKDITDLGRLAHDAYLGKNGQAKSNCAGCHINIAHLPEFDRRLLVNEKFKSRILKEEALR